MKKVLFILSILVMGLVLVSCGDKEEPVDGAIATLASAKTSLNGVFSDPSNITNNITVPTSLLSGAVTAEWTSDEPGVISFGTPDAGLVTGTVNRPALGDGDATVVVTAALSIQSELSTDMLTDTFTITLTVKENTVAEILIETVADILAVVDSEYDGTYNVTIENLSVFAAGDDAVFAYDGTGVIEVYGGASSEMEVGKVYTVAGTIDWYYGLWEITKSTATEQTGATFQAPTKEAITNVSGYIDSLITAGENSHASVADGAFEPIYASITGKVYVIPGDDSNYNTYIISSDATAFTVGSADTPAQGFMVYYHTNNLNDLRLYDGIEVTIDVVIYTYRTNNNAFAIYYVGGADGITANLTDAEKQSIDAASLSLPESTTEAMSLELPTTGNNGSTIAWTFTDSENAANSYVDLATGAVTVPTGEQVTVGITATVSFAGLDDIVLTFTLKIGEYPLSTIADAVALANGVTVRVQGVVLGYSANNYVSIQDATGGISLYNSTGVADVAALVGHNVEVVGVTNIYKDNEYLENFTVTDLGTAEYPAAFDLQTLTDWDATTLLPYQNARVTAENLKVTAYALDSYGNITMTLLDETTGNTINFKWDSRTPVENMTFLQAVAVDDYISFEGAVLGWAYGPLLSVSNGSQYFAGVAPTLTDANYVLLDSKEISIPTVFTQEDTLTLPTSGTNGSTIAWAYTDVNDTNNSLVDLATGAVTLPLDYGTVNVSITATITKGTETLTKEFVIEITYAAPTPDLLISEYIEGTPGNRKAIEIYNPTDAAIVLDNVYTLALNTNANTTWSSAIALTGTIAAGDVFVVYYDDSTNNDQLGTFGDFETTALAFNGDDAIGLFKDGVLLDLFGVFGEDPGDGWTIGEVTNATKDHVITRDPSVTVPTATWNPSQWIVVGAYVDGSVTTLGSHTVS
ncbi:MAG: immunoglobulin-like domain-containing protein [Acholeplasmataceae bacterium]